MIQPITVTKILLLLSVLFFILSMKFRPLGLILGASFLSLFFSLGLSMLMYEDKILVVTGFVFMIASFVLLFGMLMSISMKLGEIKQKRP